MNLKKTKSFLSILLIFLLLFSNLSITNAIEVEQTTDKSEIDNYELAHTVKPIKIKVSDNAFASVPKQLYLPSLLNESNLDGYTVDVGEEDNLSITTNNLNLGELKDLLKTINIPYSFTVSGENLPDMYTPRYFIIRHRVTIKDSDFDNERLHAYDTGNTHKILLDRSDTDEKIEFFVYDPDNNTGEDNDGIYEGKLYGQNTTISSYRTPGIDFAFQIFNLDSSRFNDYLLGSGFYSKEQILTSMDRTTAYDGMDLKYLSGKLTKKIRAADLARICEKVNTDVLEGVDERLDIVDGKIGKPDDIIKGGQERDIKYAYKDTYLVDSLKPGGNGATFGDACETFYGLRTKIGDDGNLGNLRKVNGNIDGLEIEEVGNYDDKVGYTDPATESNLNPYEKDYNDDKYKYFTAIFKNDLPDEDNPRDGGIIRIKIPVVGMISDYDFFEDSDNEDELRDKMVGKDFYITDVVKIMMYDPNIHAHKDNLYLTGLDELNPYLYGKDIVKGNSDTDTALYERLRYKAGYYINEGRKDNNLGDRNTADADGIEDDILSDEKTLNGDLEGTGNYFLIFTLGEDNSTVISSLSAPSITVESKKFASSDDDDIRDLVNKRLLYSETLNSYFGVMISEKYQNSLDNTNDNDDQKGYFVTSHRMSVLNGDASENGVKGNVFRNVDADSYDDDKYDEKLNVTSGLVVNETGEEIETVTDGVYHKAVVNSAKYQKYQKSDDNATLTETDDGGTDGLLHSDDTDFLENSSKVTKINDGADYRGIGSESDYNYTMSGHDGDYVGHVLSSNTKREQEDVTSNDSKGSFQQWEYNINNDSDSEARPIAVVSYQGLADSDVLNQVYLSTTLFDFSLSNKDMYCEVGMYKMPVKDSSITRDVYQDYLTSGKDFSTIIDDNEYIDTSDEENNPVIYGLFNQDDNITNNMDTSTAVSLINNSKNGAYNYKHFIPGEKLASVVQTWGYHERGYVAVRCEGESMNLNSLRATINTDKSQRKDVSDGNYAKQGETFSDFFPKIIDTSYYGFEDDERTPYKASGDNPEKLGYLDDNDLRQRGQDDSAYGFRAKDLLKLDENTNQLILGADFYINKRIDNGNFGKLTALVQDRNTGQTFSKTIYIRTKKPKTDWEVSTSIGKKIAVDANNENRDEIAIEDDTEEPLVSKIQNGSSAKIQKDKLGLIISGLKLGLEADTDTVLGKYAHELADTCSGDADFECIETEDDEETDRQNSSEFLKAVYDGGVIEAKITDPDGDVKTYTGSDIIKGTDPDDTKVVMRKLVSDGRYIGLEFFLPNDRNYLESQESFLVSITKGDFDGGDWAKDTTSSNLEATGICSIVTYEDKTTTLSNTIADNSCQYFKPLSDLNGCYAVMSGIGGDNADTFNEGDESDDAVCIYEGAFDENGEDKSDCDHYLIEDIKTEVYDTVKTLSTPYLYSSAEKLEKDKDYDFFTRFTFGGKRDGDFLKEKHLLYGVKAYITLEPEDTRVDINSGRAFTKNSDADIRKVFSKDIDQSNVTTAYDVYKTYNGIPYGCHYGSDAETDDDGNVQCSYARSDDAFDFLMLDGGRTDTERDAYDDGRSLGKDGDSTNDNRTWYGYRGTAVNAGYPKMKAVLHFYTDSDNGNYSGKDCELGSFEFNEIEEDDYEISVGTLTEEDDNGEADDIDTCNEGSGDDQAFGLTNMHLEDNKLIYNVRINNDGKALDEEGEFRLNVPYLSTYVEEVSVTKPTGSTLKVKWGTDDDTGILLEDISMDANSYADLEFRLTLKERDPACLDPTVTAKGYWRVPVANLEETTNTVDFKECMLPKIYIDKLSIDDGNENNDEDPGLYANAYPFEFTECNNNIETELRVKFKACESGDDRVLNWYVDFNTGSQRDDFIETLEGKRVKDVDPDVDDNEKIRRDMSTGTEDAVLSDSGTTYLSFYGEIEPQEKDTMRLTANNYYLKNNEPDYISLESLIDEVDCEDDNTECQSDTSGTFGKEILGQAIGKNPEVDVTTDDFLYEEGIYENEDTYNITLHRSEIDGKSKKGTPTGEEHLEPIRMKMTIDNPSINRFYGLGDLDFDVVMNSSEDEFFDTNLPADRDSDTSFEVSQGDAKFKTLSLSPGDSITLEGWSYLNKTLNTTDNPTNSATGQPAMEFDASSGTSCDYTEGFEQWKINITEDPIEMTAFGYSDDNNSNTDDGSGGTFDEHLPGDLFVFAVKLKNWNVPEDYSDVFYRIVFNDNSATISDTDLQLDLGKIYEIVGSPADGDDTGTWFDINEGDQTCRFENKTDIICKINEEIPSNSEYTFGIPLKIKLETEFYEKLKLVDETEDRKYWYPLVIDEFRRGTGELNLVDHPTDGDVVYFVSDESNLPNGAIIDHDETEIVASPNDGAMNFYIGIPYLSVENHIENLAIGNLSPGDYVNFKTKIANIGEAKVRDAKVVQDFFTTGLQTDYVDTIINKVGFKATGVNLTETDVSIPFQEWREDDDADNDFDTQNLTTLTFNTGKPTNASAYSDYIEDNLLYNGIVYANETTTYIDGSSTHADGGDIEVTTQVYIEKLKNSKFPQIGCDDLGNCDRGVDEGENPKIETQVSIYDIPYVATANDGNTSDDYRVYFPIPKSVLFQRKGSSYTLGTTSNPIIKGVINSPNTTVTYRVDNFLPDDYDHSDDGTGNNRNEDAIGKMRSPQAVIRLPMGVRYVENSANYIENLDDTAPYGDPTPMSEPEIVDVNEYVASQQLDENTFDDSFLTNPDWHLIEGTTKNNNYQIQKGTPFKFNYYNKSYNYYRITDDGAIGLGYSVDMEDTQNFDEGEYYHKKREGKIQVKEDEQVVVTVGRILTNVLLPEGVEYFNETGERSISDGVNYVIIKGGSNFTISDGEEVIFTEGMEYLSFDDDSKIEVFKDNVDHGEEDIKDYIVIAPAFVKLDLRDQDNKGHGVYEKINTNDDGSIYSVSYIWYGYYPGTTKEVKMGVTLYNGSSTNNILFQYGDIDSNLTEVQYSGIFNGINEDGEYEYSDYSGLELKDLSNADDMLFNAANVYQQLTFTDNFGYAAEGTDLNQSPLLMYQQRDPADDTHPFTKGPGKDETAFAFTFNVVINTDDTVCGTEYTRSAGGNTLSWDRKDSSRADVDDINMFCFSALRPGMAIINNATYARGGYKYSNDVCVVKNIALMGFNANAVGWNTDTSLDDCWSRYNIKTINKDLTLNTTNPYDMLPELKEKIDRREIDIQQIMAHNKIVLNSDQEIQIKNAAGVYQKIDEVISGFETKFFTIMSKKNFAIFGYDGNDSYIVTTNTEGERWEVVKTFENKEIDYGVFNDNVVIIFFKDGTFARNNESGVGSYTDGNIVDYTNINEIAYRTLSNVFMVGDNGMLWESSDAGKSWEARDMKDENGLQTGEALTSISIYGAKEIWISTSRGNVLYSYDRGETFEKKTTGSTLEVPLMTFEDGDFEFKNFNFEHKFGTKTSVDNQGNENSIKFYNSNSYLNEKGLLSRDSTNSYSAIFGVDDNDVKLDFSSFEKDGNVIKGDLYYDIFISDINKTGAPTSIELMMENNAKGIQIHDTCQFEVRGNGCQNGWNTFKVEIREDSEDDKYELKDIGDIDWGELDHIEWYSSIGGDEDFPGERMIFQNVRYADIDNLDNIITINDFSDAPDETWVIEGTSDKKILELTDGSTSLESFKTTDNTINGFLVIDLYVEDKDAEKISKIEFGSADDKKIIWDNPYQFIDGTLESGWNTLLLPFDDESNDDISYENKYDINWDSLKILNLYTDTTSSNKQQSFALDNVLYSDIAGTNFKFIRFYNSTQGNAFDDNIVYLTDDNITWGAIEDLNISDLSFLNMKIIRGTEIYGIANTPDGWATYYTLDKGTNSVLYNDDGGIHMKGFDMLDYNYGYSVSEDNILYTIDLVSI